MDIQYLISFKDNNEVKELEEEHTKLFSLLFSKSYSKKNKKKIIKPTSNFLKNSKIQLSKDKTKNKVNLIINKLSENNFDEILKEFITIFQEIEIIDYNKILTAIFEKIIKDDKFIQLFFRFFKDISNIYKFVFNLSHEHFINLIEKKIKYDYLKEELEDEFLFLEKYDKEENRITNLKLLVLLIENNYLKKDIIKVVSSYLVETNNIPDIYNWFSSKIIKKQDKITNYNENLTNKLNEDINNRYIVLLKSLLDSNDISYNEIINCSDEEEDIELGEIEELNYSDYEIEIRNILEEYLLLEEFDEVKDFLNQYKNENENLKIFMSSLINIYFTNNLSNNEKFKNLFINLKKNKLIQSEIFKSSLISLLESEEKDDYNNFKNKLDKLIEIYKIIQVKVSKNFLKEFKLE